MENDNSLFAISYPLFKRNVIGPSVDDVQLALIMSFAVPKSFVPIL